MDSKKFSISLEFNAKTGGFTGKLNAAKKDLEQFGRTAEKSMSSAEKSANKVVSSTDRIANSLQKVGHYGATAFAGLQVAQYVNSTIKLADAYASLQGKLKLATSGAQEMAFVQDQLLEIANATRSSLPEMADLYSSLGASFKALGRSTNDSLSMVDTFSRALALTAPTAAQSASAILQFSQAMGSGVLRGEEFNAIMESGRGVAQTLADGLGVPIGALRQMAEQGQLTAEIVIQALESQAAVVDEKFAQLPLTVSGSMQVLQNEMLSFVGEMDASFGLSSSLAQGIVTFSENIEYAAKVTGTVLAAALLGKAVPAVWAYGASMAAATPPTAMLATTTRGLTAAALAFAKTPIGKAAAVATAAMFYFAESQDEAVDSANKLIDRLEKTKGGFEALGRAQTKQALEEINAEIDKLRVKVFTNQDKSLWDTLFGDPDEARKTQEENYLAFQKLIKERDKYQAKLEQPVELPAINVSAPKESHKELTDYQKAQEASWIEAVKAFHEEYRQELEADQKAFEAWADAGLDAQESYDDALEDITGQLELVGKTTAEVAVIEARRFAQNQGWSQTQINEYVRQVEQLNKVKSAHKQHADAIRDVSDEFDPFAKAWENAFDRMDNDMAAMFRNFEFTAEGVFDVVENAFKNMLAEMAYAATIRPLIVGVQGAITGNGVGGAGNMLGSIGNAYSLSSDLLSGSLFGSSIYGGLAQAGLTTAYGAGGFGAANSVIGTLGASGNYAGAASYAAGSYLPLIGGALYGYQQKGVESALTGAGGAYLGAKIGTALLPGIGTAIGGLLGAIGGGSILGTDWSTKDYGAQFDASVSGFDADYYKYRTKQESFWRGTKRKTTYDDAPEIEQAIGSVITAMLSELDANANQLGLDLADTLTFTVKESFKGLDDAEIAATIQKMTTDIYMQAADSIEGLDELVAPFTMAGETSGDALGRIITQFNIVDDTLENLGADLGTLSQSGVEAAQNIISVVGGLDAFAAASQSYYQNFYTEQERFEDLTDSLVESLADVNLQLPETRQGYRALVESLDDGTQAQQEQIATLINLNGVADQYYDNLEQSARESASAIGDLSNNLSAATASMQQMADAARTFGNSLVQSAVNTVNAQASAISSIEGLISSLELEIGQAEQADAQLAENLRVEAINAEIANFNAGIEQQILALEEQKAAQEQAYLAEIERIELEKTNNDAQLESLENLTGVIQDQLNELTKLRDSVTSAREAFEDEGLSADQSYKLGQSMLRDIITSGDAANLDRALGLASSISTDSFATALDYKLARAESASLMRTLEEQLGEQIDPLEAQLSELEQQSNALEMANDALNDIESAITGVSEQYDFQIAALRAQLKESVQANTLFDQSLSAQKAASKDALALMSSQLDVLKDIDESLASGQGLTSSILESLYDQYDLIDRNADAQVTFDEFKLMFAGVSDKDTLQKLFLITDRNGDGIISKLDALNAQAYQQKDLWIAELLPIIDAISNQQLTQDQMVFALQGLASEEQAIALFNALDTDNNGILTKLEAQNGILLDLSPRLESVISNGFAGLDANLSGGLTFDELELGLSGIATDAQLRAIFAELDSNGNQTISALEALGRTFSQALTQNFASLDRSRDGLLSAAEVQASVGPSVSQSTVEAAVRELDVNNDKVVSQVEAENKELASEIQRIYAEELNRTDVDTEGQQFWSEAVKELNLSVSDLEKEIAQAAVGTQQSDMVKDWALSAYATLGRTGFGEAQNQIDLEGYNFWANAIAAGTFSDQADFMNNFLAAAGYQSGGFTANIATDKIAGVVHGGEYVAPSSQLEKYPELFAALEADRKGHLDLEIPAYAAGGVHSGGLRLVGERGPELEFTGPSRIYSNNDTLKMLDNSRLEFLVEKLIRRIEDLEEQAARTAVATQDSADLLNRFSRGLPTYNIEVQ